MTTQGGTHPGDKSAAELEREVEAKRAEVEENLDALQDRLSPGQLMDQLFDYARNGNGAEFTRNLGRSMRDNPIPVALIGAGMAWLMAGGQRAPYRMRYGDDFDRDWDDDWYDDDEDGWRERDWDDRFASDEDDLSGDPVAFGMTPQARGGDAPDPGSDDKGIAAKAGEMADDLKDRASAAGERLGDAARDARDGLQRQGRRLRRGAGRYRDEFGRHAGRYGRRVRRGFLDTLEEQPLVLGAIGVAVGAALGAALPPTEHEDELMGETRDRLKRQAVEEGRRQVEKARDVAEAAYGAAKDEADRQDLTAESGKAAAGSLGEKAAKVAEAAKTAAEKEASAKS